MGETPVKVIVEIERHSNQKWEYDRVNDRLFLDRTLKYPFFYPYAYGFFPKTLGDDGDELDMLLITDRPYSNYNYAQHHYEGYIVGGLMMHDEKGEDAKIFVVPLDEIEQYKQKSDAELQSIFEDIAWFFAHYKSKDTDGKWSRVDGTLTTEQATDLYNASVQKYQQNI
jgi:inorganic pyrophosphatase